MSTQVQPNVPARQAVVYTAGNDEGPQQVTEGIEAAYFNVFRTQTFFADPQGVIDQLAEQGSQIGGYTRMYKVTVEEVGTTE